MVMMIAERTEQLLVSNRQTTFDRQLDAAKLGRFGSQVNFKGSPEQSEVKIGNFGLGGTPISTSKKDP